LISKHIEHTRTVLDESDTLLCPAGVTSVWRFEHLRSNCFEKLIDNVIKSLEDEDAV